MPTCGCDRAPCCAAAGLLVASAGRKESAAGLTNDDGYRQRAARWVADYARAMRLTLASALSPWVSQSDSCDRIRRQALHQLCAGDPAGYEGARRGRTLHAMATRRPRLGGLGIRDALLRGFTRIPTNRVLKVLLPVTVVFVLVFWVEYRRQVETDQTQLLAHEAAAIQVGVRGIERELAIATGDLQIEAALDAHFLGRVDPNEATGGTRRMVVDSEGRWVRDRREGESAVATKNGGSFERAFPGVLPQLLVSPRAWVESSEGFFQLRPLTLPPAAPSADLALVSLVPSQLLDDIAIRRAMTLLLIATPLYYALIAVGWLVAAAFHRRDEALRNHEEARNSMMHAALDGIVVMDEAGTSLELNRSAQRIFGYTLEEARGRLVADLIIPPDRRNPIDWD